MPEVDGLRIAAEYAYTMMRLAMPSLFVWLTGFYMLFHCWCNALAEVRVRDNKPLRSKLAWLLRHTARQVLRFADRKFYGTWWNATDLRSFWKLWNLREWVCRITPRCCLHMQWRLSDSRARVVPAPRLR